jgi:hypothetical protein
MYVNIYIYLNIICIKKCIYIYINNYHNHNHVCIQRSYANFPPVLRLGLCPLKHGSGFSMSSLTGLPRPTTLTAPELQLVQGARHWGVDRKNKWVQMIVQM